MIIISHRGNINGPNSVEENSPDSIDNALLLYQVEIDIRLVYDKLFLGHDIPLYEVDLKWLLERSEYLWIHCKNIAALNYLIQFDNLNVFSHDIDDVVLTSKKYLWTFPKNSLLYNRSIAVLPENVQDWDLTYCFGVCTDFPSNFRY
jgi:hypothetical protein